MASEGRSRQCTDIWAYRREFNDRRYVERRDAGTMTVRRNASNPARDVIVAKHGAGTVTEIWYYFEAGRLVAVSHEYVRSDGQRVDRPDPKGLDVGGVWWLPPR